MSKARKALVAKVQKHTRNYMGTPFGNPIMKSIWHNRKVIADKIRAIRKQTTPYGAKGRKSLVRTKYGY